MINSILNNAQKRKWESSVITNLINYTEDKRHKLISVLNGIKELIDIKINELNNCLDSKEYSIIQKIKKVETISDIKKEEFAKWNNNASKYLKIIKYTNASTDNYENIDKL